MDQKSSVPLKDEFWRSQGGVPGLELQNCWHQYCGLFLKGNTHNEINKLWVTVLLQSSTVERSQFISKEDDPHCTSCLDCIQEQLNTPRRRDTPCKSRRQNPNPSQCWWTQIAQSGIKPTNYLVSRSLFYALWQPLISFLDNFFFVWHFCK